MHPNSGHIGRRDAFRLGAAAGVGAMLSTSRKARAAGVVRIGVLTDLSGPLSDYAGPTSVTAARMAAAEFGTVLDRKIEVIAADHQNKPDVGSAIARQWFDEGGVDAIADIPNSAVALAVQQLASERGKITLLTGPASGALMNEGCSRTGFLWVLDTYSNTVGPSRVLMKQGLSSWFLLVSDYAYGHQMETDLSRSVTAAGGRIVGSVSHPVGTTDYSSFLLQAQASGAQVVAMLNAGADLVNSVKQAAEFGLTQSQKFFLPGAVISDVHSLGLATAQGLLLMNGFYWDRNDSSRAWSQSFFKQTNRMPGQIQAGTYSAVLTYLKGIQAAGTTDGPKVAEAMRATPVNDMFVQNGRIRPDGRLIHDFYVVQVKSPAESKAPWDYYKITATIPGEEAMQPLETTRCPYLK